MTMPTTPRVSIGALSERDVDLLLVEEFSSSPDFVRWFFERIDSAVLEPLEVVRCCRSATDSTGESDVEVFVQAGGEVIAILIENKVHARAQPRQADRYRERGESHARADRCRRFITVLVAPQTYLGGNVRGFDKTISYEDIVARLEDAEVVSARSRFKAEMLRGAIEKATKGYRVVEDRPVMQFWKRYWERSQAVALDLDMKEPGGLPASSSFVYFRPGGMPRGSYLVHKMTHGFIDIQFDGMAEKLTQLQALYGPSLEDGMKITRAGKSGVIRTKVERLRPTDDADKQLESIDACLRRANEFLEWFRRVRALAKGPHAPAVKLP